MVLIRGGVFLSFVLIMFCLPQRSLAEALSGGEILRQSSKGLVFANRQEMGLHDSNENSLVIVGVGDVLLHRPLHVQGLAHSNGHSSLWERVNPWIQAADMAYANQRGRWLLE